MKKIISVILTLTLLVLAFAACGKKNTEDEVLNENEIIVETDETVNDGEEEKADGEKNENKTDVGSTEKKPETVKPGTSTEKPAQTTKPENKPQTNEAVKPETTPETKPEAQQPAVKPEANTPATLGNTLLADFKVKAASMNTLALAEALVTNPVIQFSGGAMTVEPGLLSGFGNTEITGFKEGAMFAPMIGSIAFVGYIFELENAADAPAFISKLKSNADMRWNICVEAEEMVTGSVGTKVFFVMCPTSLED